MSRNANEKHRSALGSFCKSPNGVEVMHSCCRKKGWGEFPRAMYYIFHVVTYG